MARAPAATAGALQLPASAPGSPLKAARLPSIYTPSAMQMNHPLSSGAPLFGDSELAIFMRHLRNGVRGPEANPII